MTIDLSSSTDPEISLAATILCQIKQLMVSYGIVFLVVGATARNIVSIGVFGSAPGRATRDIDIAVAVATWDEVRRLRSEMSPIDQSCHRFDVCGVPVDIIPCGPIENNDRTVDWPEDFRMNTLGFREAFAADEIALLPGQLSVRVPSIAAQTLLKLVAWHDRHWRSTKDAIDLATMLDWYSSGHQLNILYTEHIELLATYDYDATLASAHRLGQDIALLLETADSRRVQPLLDDPVALQRLANDMTGPFDQAHQRMSALYAGIRTERAVGRG
ncbi:nucleotidyl transferase AbiEii/AbiGii toxin family protein [Nocardia sp. NPDC051052]|uniref:nucleotidyl transferase AbiEii/AbiGii toxin family protein n=1 Tax=Nocardia sp. NPDC051052 TaxID=3364322 RepID=UPI00378A79EE